MHRILIVDDSSTMRALITAAFESLAAPCKITAVASGFEALAALPRDAFDLIVTDINMPDINGLELVSFAKANPKFREIPLVIVSTEGSERDRAKGMSLGADAYVVKPFQPEELCRVVEDLLANRAARERA
jgi:two-component system chemotaxis response regulator CheY